MSSPTEHSHLQRAMSRIDGIDAVQLLDAIGEASANTSQTELFRLCIAAQQILCRLQDASPANVDKPVAPHMRALDATCAAMSDDGRERLTSFARHLQRRFPRLRASLTIVPAGGAR